MADFSYAGYVFGEIGNDSFENSELMLLNSMQDGFFNSLIGIKGNHPVKVTYCLSTCMEFINQNLEHILLLYDYQLNVRLRYYHKLFLN